ncbi:MAG TPA: MazG family protein [Spirochaetia bacterium]|nr:MazG family protein [Spirochaetia bacterium]
MYEETERFTLTEVLSTISAKLIRRHPHVFSKKGSITIPEIMRNWDYIKEHIEGKKKKKSAVAGIPGSLPPLERAYALQKKAAKVGFDWRHAADVIPKLKEEILELEEAVKADDTRATEEELGDLLFSVVNLARKLNADPSLALERTNRKFTTRFHRMEEELAKRNIPCDRASLALLDEIWNTIKKAEPGDRPDRQGTE